MPDDHDAESIEDLADRKQKKWQALPATQLSLEVRPHPAIDGDPWITGSLKLKGQMPVRQDLHHGEELTVQVANADGQVIAVGLFEVGLPAFKDITVKGTVGSIGVERVHSAEFQEED